MISIRKYLSQTSARTTADADAGESTARLLAAASNLCADLERRVLDKPRFETLRTDVAQLRASIAPGMSIDQACRIGECISAILEEYEYRREQAAAKTGAEMQSILAMLNQSMMTLAAGHERSVSRLQTIQGSLQHTSRLRDLVAMRTSLADALRFVQSECSNEQEISRKDVASLQADIAVARELLAESRGGLQEREAGVRALADASAKTMEPSSLFAVAFRFDRMRGLVQRYGPEVAEELLFLLIKERVYRLSSDSQVYRWAPASIVSLLACHRVLEVVRDEVGELSRQPLVHRIGVGDRTATLTLVPSHMVCEVRQETLEANIEELDRFAQIGE
jgi:hypothetical protein